MANTSKIVDRAELLRWFEEGRPLRWMVEEYQRKYGVKTTTSMFGNFADREGLELRIVHADKLVPWRVAPEHKMQYAATMLRNEARRRAGKPLAGDHLSRTLSWVESLNERGMVIDYSPEQGFIEVPRTDDDTDIVREPKSHNLRRRQRASKRQ